MLDTMEELCMVQENTNTLASHGYCITDLNFPQDERNSVCGRVTEIFTYAMGEGKNDPRFLHLTARMERASLPITIDDALETAMRRIVARSIITRFAFEFWQTNALLYSRKFSMFRFVDPDRPEQLEYSPLHVDESFLNSPSVNVCIPLTAYGKEHPGLKLYPGINRAISEAEAKIFPAVEPYVPLGKCLAFTEKMPHCRTTEDKSKPRINCEFRLFPAGSRDLDGSKGLAAL